MSVSKLLTLFFLVGVVQGHAANPIQDLVDQALSNGESEVIIPPGTYRVSDTLELKGVRDFTLIADDVTMILTRRRINLLMRDCSNVTIQGLTMDTDPLPFTQATIYEHARDWSWVKAKIDDGYPQDPLPGAKIELYKGDTGLLFPNVFTLYGASVKKLSSNTLQVNNIRSRFRGKGIEVGDKLVLECPMQNAHAVKLENVDHSTFSNVTLHASTSFGFFESSGSTNNAYLGVDIIPGPPPVAGGAPRLRSVNADGIHSKHAAVGPRVENSRIIANGDDAVAISGEVGLILEVNGNKLISSPKWGEVIQVGDRVRGFNPAGEIIFETEATGVTRVSGYDALLADVLRDSGIRTRGAVSRTYEITLASTVPAEPGSYIYPIDRVGNGYIIRNNYIGNKRARGILIKAGEGLIEGNTIERNHMGSIVLTPEIAWMGAGFSRSVRIINNTITHGGSHPNDVNSYGAGAITVAAEGGSGFAPAGAHMDIEISGNRIVNSLGVNILATSIDGLTIKDNVLMDTHTEERKHGINRGVDPNAGISIINCSNVTVEGNMAHNFGGQTDLQLVDVSSFTGQNSFSPGPQD